MPARIGFDTETWLIQAGLLAPPLVCGSFHWADCEETPGVTPTWLELREGALLAIESLLRQDTHILVQNGAFDFGVVCNERPDLLPLVFRAYEDGRIRDCRVRDKLILLARGEMKTDEDGRKSGFSLAEIVQRRFGIDLSGDKTNPDAWRLRYRELDRVPLEAWPEEAVRYAKDDAVWNVRIFDHQAAECELENVLDYLPNEVQQTRRAWSNHLKGMWGLRTDIEAVSKLESRIRAVREDAHEVLRMPARAAYERLRNPPTERFKLLVDHAFDKREVSWDAPDGTLPNTNAPVMKVKTVKRKATGLVETEESRDTKVIQALVERDAARRGVPALRTAPSTRYPDGQVSTAGEVLEGTTDPRLLLLAAIGNDEKIGSVWLDHLLAGVQAPVNPTWNNPVATGRTSCWKPPMQQPMRKGGVRECFVPRPGFLFLATDYSFIELVSWAQVCLDLFGVSDLADLIREGKDPHSVMAVEILHAAGEHLDIDYDGFRTALKAGEEWAADARQLAKAANFGLPGGLGAKTFIDFAWANYGVRISLEKAENVKRIWKRMYREADMYFAHIKSLGGAYGESFQIVQLRSGRVRGGCTFTSAANSFFQGLTADGTEEADWRITKECYLGSSDLALAAEVRAGRRAPEPLYGCRPVAFLHDEFILEVPGDDTTEASIDAVHAANVRLKEHMIEGMKVFVPDVPVGAEESLMRRWYKGAKPVFDEKGRLRVWEPKER